MTAAVLKKTILVVDDDPDIGVSLEAIFTSEGYRVIIARHGLEGLDLARKDQPDVILLDVMMPVLDGYGFLDAQKDDPTISDIPVIVLSAGMMLDRIPSEIPRLPKPPELLALFALVESRVNRPRPSKSIPNAAIPAVGRYPAPESPSNSPVA
jgi:CheY-like chemotaxis protein